MTADMDTASTCDMHLLTPTPPTTREHPHLPIAQLAVLLFHHLLSDGSHSQAQRSRACDCNLYVHIADGERTAGDLERDDDALGQ